MGFELAVVGAMIPPWWLPRATCRSSVANMS